MQPVDLVLIEGFPTHRHPALEVYRPSEGRDLMWREASDIVEVARNEALAGMIVPILDLSDANGIADFILARANRLRAG